MNYKVNKAVVIGSGTMGAAIAAHLANAKVNVTLLDIVPRELTPEEKKKGMSLDDRVVRNRIVRQGLERAMKSRPASFFTKDFANLVEIGNLEDDFNVIESADWVIEAIIENLDIKRQLMESIDAIRSPNTIISTNTSGIQIASIVEGRSDGFRKHFLGTHFFNPPRYLKLLEIIPSPDTLPEVLRFIEEFGEKRLGKGIVPAKDTPNFIANRLFAASAAFVLDYVLKNNYTVPEVDAITGPPIGNPKTATFRLFDLVGIDVWEHVGNNLASAIQDDELAMQYMNSEPVTQLIHTMVENGWLGNKVKQGFYKQVRGTDGKKEFWSLDLQSLEYRPPAKVRFEVIGKVKDEPDLGKRLKVLLEANDRVGELVRAVLYQSFQYASARIPEIADTPKPIDDAMRWGFGREAGPFEMWDLLGVAETVKKMKEAGFPPAPWVDEMLSKGIEKFYDYKDDIQSSVYDPQQGSYVSIERPAGLILLKKLKAEGRIIKQNLGANLIDLGDGVACVEFHTKMNALDNDIFEIIDEGLNLAEGGLEGLVIGNEGEHFSAGANLFLIVMLAQNGDWEQLDGVVRKMQNLLMRIRYFPKPVVIAPAGLALGGGSEVIMSGSRVVAGAELYAGLVEIGVGVIPAGSGTKEMVRRILNPPMRTKDAEPLPYLQRIFEQIGFAKVATSAEEARQFGILNQCDRVVMNREHLLTEAKKEVLSMASSGYTPPLPEKIFAAGRDGLAAMQIGAYMLNMGKFITEHEKLIATKLAGVMTGGNISKPTWVDEQYFLDLEREAFLSLCGEKKTQERLWHMLQTGKPLRN